MTSVTSDGYIYNLYGIHFHWGNTSDTGSEHRIDNTPFPLEIHFVHFRNDFNNISDAICNLNEANLAAVGILFELDTNDNDNEYLNILLNNISIIEDYNTSINLSQLNMYDMLMQDSTDSETETDNYNEFWNYEGSLTTPPCDPIVRWYVLKNKLKISQRQLEKFQLLNNNHNKKLHLNWREVQDNDNAVYYYVLNGNNSDNTSGNGNSGGNGSDNSSGSRTTCSTSFMYSVIMMFVLSMYCLF